jgi:protein-disulfide isomerase
MLTRLATVGFVALLSLSPPPQSQADEIAALKRQVQELREQQAQMQRELAAIKTFLQALVQARQPGAPEVAGIVGASIPTANEPTMGSSSAKVTLMEISDYHCPFCKRQTQQTFPQLVNDYVKTGKIQFVFVDYPIAQLHPNAARAHQAAICAGEQGKYWEMHVSLFNNPVAKDDAALAAQAKQVGLDTGTFQSCLTSGRHAASVQASAARMEQLGISGTPMVVLGYTPAPGQPLKVEKYVYGAQPYSAFKEAIDSMLR